LLESDNIVIEEQQQQPQQYQYDSSLLSHEVKHDDDDTHIDIDNNNNNIFSDNNKIKHDAFNMPPSSYTNSYSSLATAFNCNDSYPIKQLFDAACTPIAVCKITNFAIATPFIAKAWAQRLAATRYPNPAAAVTLVKCLRIGVDLGFHGDRHRIQIGRNLQSADEHPTAIDKNIADELQIGRRKGPFSHTPFDSFYSNPLGVVFKKGKPKPRVIHHLSWPRSNENSTSVNASITDFAVKLDAFDKALVSVRELGKGCLMSKIDIESAYRCIPVRPDDWPLLGLQWQNQFYFDIVMQFGITSATAIFEWYSSAAQYIAQHSCAQKHLVHYVDDFILFNQGLSSAKLALESVLKLFAELGIPISMNKLEGPSTSMVFLGILFDSDTMTIRLDDEKLACIHDELLLWSERMTASKEQLQSIIGVLSFAAKVVAPGRTFLRRMIDHMKTLPSNATQHPLSKTFHLDLQWWRRFLSKWNGISIIPDTQWTQADALHIYTDACVAGYGAVFESHWFSCTWTVEEEQQAKRDKRDSMPFKELYALAKTAATWGSHWSGRKILFHTDCQPNVDAWRKGDSRKPQISHLIRTLMFIAATHHFNMNLVHIAGVDNVCADLLSRGQVQLFLECPGQHDPSPTIPLPLPIQTW
jgi:hypothetical protein